MGDNTRTMSYRMRKRTVSNANRSYMSKASGFVGFLVLLFLFLSLLMLQIKHHNAVWPPSETTFTVLPSTTPFAVPSATTLRNVPDNICFYVVIRYNTTSWTPAYLQEFETFMAHFLLPSLQQQTIKGAIPVLDGTLAKDSVLVPLLENLGGIPGHSVAQHVQERSSNCEYVIQSRIDADDSFGIEFVETIVDMLQYEVEYAMEGPGFCGEWWQGKACGRSKEPPPALVFSQPRLTRVYLFGEQAGSRKCLYRRRPYSTKDLPLSTGLTLALSRKSYDDDGHTNVLNMGHDQLLAIAKSKWKGTKHLFFPADRLTLAPVTSLSGHYPWFFNSAPYPPCSLTNMTRILGRELARQLLSVPLPNMTLWDSCTSNQHAQGIMARNVKFQYQTCHELYQHYLDLRRGWENGTTVPQYPWPW